jgi:hypothetical protein
LDLLPWVQKNLLPSEIKESTCERVGELKIKFEKERMRVTKRKMENLKNKNKNWIGKKKLDRKKKLKRERNSKEEGEEE